MGVKLGMPSIKLNCANNVGKNCGSFMRVAMEALRERKGQDTDIDNSKSDQNIIIGFKTAAELINYSNKHIQELNLEIDRTNNNLSEINALREAQGQKPLKKLPHLRKDAVRMCNTIIKPPAAWVNKMSRADQIRFFYDVLEVVYDIIGKENVKSVAIHFDEQAPHMHIFWEPMTLDGRLCAKEIHSRKFFNRINREMPRRLREKGWEIDDCHSYDADEHKELKNKLGEEDYHKYLADRRSKNGRSSFKYKTDAEHEKEKYLKSVTPSATKKVKPRIGKEKIVNKTEQELQSEELILSAQAVLKTKDDIEAKNKRLQMLLDHEEEKINQEADRKAKAIITTRELDAIKRAQNAENKANLIETALQQKFNISVDELLSNKVSNRKPKIGSKNDKQHDLERSK